MGAPQDRFAQDAKRVAKDERRIQDGVEAKAARSFAPGEDDDAPPPQTGARAYPVPPLPGKHLEKPGL